MKEINISVIYTFSGIKENRKQCAEALKNISDAVEVICIGENVDDEAMQIYSAVAKDKKNIQIHSVEGNHQKALNTGIKNATKEYVVFVNEGIIVADTIEKLDAFWAAKQEETDLVMYDLQYDRSQSKDFESEGMLELKEQHILYSKSGVYRMAVHPYNFYVAENVSVRREYATANMFDETISWENALFVFFMKAVADKSTISVCVDMVVKNASVIEEENQNDNVDGARIYQKVIEDYKDYDVWVKRFCYATILQEINRKYNNGEIFRDVDHFNDIDVEYQKLIQQMEIISIIKTTISAANRVFFIKLHGGECQLSADFLSFVLYYGDTEIWGGDGIGGYVTNIEREGDEIAIRIMVGNPIFSYYKPTFYMVKGKKRTKIDPAVSSYQYSVGNDSNICYYTFDCRLSATGSDTVFFETEFADLKLPIKIKRRRNLPHGNFPQDRTLYLGSTKIMIFGKKMKAVDQGMRAVALKIKRERELKKLLAENNEKMIEFRAKIQKYLKQTKDMENIVFIGMDADDTRAFDLYTKHKNANVYYITEDASLVDNDHILALDSEKAKLVYCSAKYIYVDVLDYKKVWPLDEDERITVSDICSSKVMYLAKPESRVDNVAVYGEDVVGIDGMVMLSEEQEKIVKEKYTYKLVSQDIIL